MATGTIGALREQAEAALCADRYASALALYVRIVELQPSNLDARLRVADALLAMGEVQRAAVVYTALARHAALAGYPLRALIALKMLSAIEPRLGILLRDFAALYARGSTRLGRSVRKALPDPNQPLPATPAPTHDPATLADDAERIARSYDNAGLLYPDKLIPLPLFSLLDPLEFGAVLDALRLLRVRPGTTIVREAEPGQSFFVLARGMVTVTAQQKGETRELAQLHDGAVFGEMALLAAAPRTATVTAATDSDVLEFDCTALSHASNTLASLATALSEFARERLLRNVVASSALFGPLDPTQRMALVRRFVAQDAAPGAEIIAEGQPGHGLYVILRGEVVVTRQHAELARLGPGDMFGEIALLQNEPTTATVRATDGGASLLFLGREYFERLIAAVPELRAYLERLSEDRMMDLRISMAMPEPVYDALSNATDDEIEVDIDL